MPYPPIFSPQEEDPLASPLETLTGRKRRPLQALKMPAQQQQQPEQQQPVQQQPVQQQQQPMRQQPPLAQQQPDQEQPAAQRLASRSGGEQAKPQPKPTPAGSDYPLDPTDTTDTSGSVSSGSGARIAQVGLHAGPHAAEVDRGSVPTANTQEGYGAISGEEQMRRPAHYTGTITVGDQSFQFGTGGGRSPSLPYGRYYLTGTIGSVGQRIGALFGISDSPHSGNTVNDPLTGSAREGVEVHPDVSGHLASSGCIAVNASQFPDFEAAVRKMQAQGQELVLQVNPDGSASISPVGSPQGSEVAAYAKGGIVTKPTVALVGEKGPEAIVPLKSLSSGAFSHIRELLKSSLSSLGDE